MQRLAGQARRPHWLLTVAYFSHGTGRLHRGLLRPRQRRRSDSATPFRRDVLILRSHPASLRPQAVDCSAYPAERCIIVAYRPSVEHLSLFGVLVGRGAELLVVAGEREVGSGGEKEGFGLIRAKLFHVGSTKAGANVPYIYNFRGRLVSQWLLYMQISRLPEILRATQA